MGPKMFIVVLNNYVVFVHLCVFPIHLFVNIACVMFDTWFWHNTNVGNAL
jgi:hypothetical protein